MSRRAKLTDQQREQRRQADRQRLQAAVSALLSSEGWARWVRVRARNGLGGRYSWNNQLLIALQTQGEATYVCGFRAWQQLGYAPRKGSKALRILAPRTVKTTEVDHATGEKQEDPRLYFRAVAVFDRASVDPIPGADATSLEAPCEPLTGDSHRHLLERLAAFAGELGYTITYQQIPGACGGWCDAKAKAIVVDAAAPANAQVRILTHELAHALGVGYDQYPRAQAEVIVDCVTHVCCSGAGLDVSGESVPYIAGWGQDGAIEAVSAFAQTIDSIARQLEEAIADPADHAAEAPTTRAAPELVAA